MFTMLERSWQLFKASYAVLRQDKELMLFPLLSAIGLIAVTITFVVPMAALGIFETVSTTSTQGGEVVLSDGQTVTLAVIGFLYYFVSYLIIIFSNSALIGAAMMRLRGEDPTVQDGFRIASSRLGPIVGYALIAATVGMILQSLRNNRRNIISQIVGSLLGMAWSLLTFLVVPVLVMENAGPIEAIKRSSSLLKQTWGENIAANVGVGLFQFLAMLAVGLVIGLPLYLLVTVVNTTIVTIFAIAVVVIAMAIVALFFSAIMGIFQAALYNYATGGEADTFFDPALVRGAFQRE